MDMMLMVIALYLTYNTFSYAKKVWKVDNKFAGICVFLLSGCFLPIAVYLATR